MTEGRSHATTANRLARKFSTEYNRGHGADSQISKITIKVATPETIKNAGR